MKTIRYFSFVLLSALALAFSSCTEEEAYKVGEPDSMFCQYFYFPSQDNIKDHMLSESDVRALEFTASRTNDYGETTIPFKIECSEEGIFQLEEDAIYFDDSKTTTKFKVKFPDAELGKKYTCTIKVEDPEYVSKYTLENTQITFSVMIVNWKELGEATWRDDFFTSYGFLLEADLKAPYLEKKVKVYERSDKKGYYRFDKVYTPEYVSMIYGNDESMAEELIDYCSGSSLYIDATDPEKVWIDLQHSGMIDPFLDYGPLYICSDVEEVWDADYSNLYGKLVDGVITFPKNSLILYMPNSGVGVYSNTAGQFRVVLPGGVAYDYNVDVKVSESKNGKLPMEFILGKDVRKVKYQVFEGRISEVEVESKLEEVIATKGLDEVTESCTVNFTEAKTGFYTVIACAYGSDGRYKNYATAQFGYDTADDPRDIDINYGLIVSDKYAASGRTSENTMEFYLYGKDIVEAKVALYKKTHLDDFDDEIIESEFKYSIAPLTKKQLDSLNKGVYSGLISGLAAGSEYILVVYADNGYHKAFFRTSASTEGEYNPLDVTYSSYDIPSKHQPKLHDDYFGDWELWSADPFKSSWVRKNRATVTFVDKSDLYFDEEGKVTKDPEAIVDTLDRISLIGMHPKTAAKHKDFVDKIDFEFYDGFVYTLVTQCPEMGTIETEDGEIGYPTNAYLYFGKDMLTAGIENGAMVGGFTSDGTIVLVPNPMKSASYVVMTLCYFSSPDATGDGRIIEEGHAYPMLARPGTMDEYVNDGTEVKEKVQNISKALYNSRTNYVETERGYMKSLIDRINAMPENLIERAEETTIQLDNKPAHYKMVKAFPEEETQPKSFSSYKPVELPFIRRSF